jgi:hypothetical protein
MIASVPFQRQMFGGALVAPRFALYWLKEKRSGKG